MAKISQRSPSQHKDPAPPNDQQATVKDILCQTTSKTGTQHHPLAQRLPKIIISHRHPKTHHQMWTCPPERQHPASSTRTQALVPSTRKPTQPTEPPLATGNRHQNNRNYEPAACKKETTNKVS